MSRQRHYQRPRRKKSQRTATIITIHNKGWTTIPSTAAMTTMTIAIRISTNISASWVGYSKVSIYDVEVAFAIFWTPPLHRHDLFWTTAIFLQLRTIVQLTARRDVAGRGSGAKSVADQSPWALSVAKGLERQFPNT